MSRLIQSMVTFFTVTVSNASSSFALDFWQPLPACYGQVISGDDETLFNYQTLGVFISEDPNRH